MIRKAVEQDLDSIEKIYNRIHDREEEGESSIGWVRGVYPTGETARKAMELGELFVESDCGEITAAAIINQKQVPEYADCSWEYPASDDEVMVLHTLTVDPVHAGKGYGSTFVRFYEQYAKEHGCGYLRMDTQSKNLAARKLYRKLGYREPGIVSCTFNGIPNVELVCLEKRISEDS